jgi:hypothetical protein
LRDWNWFFRVAVSTIDKINIHWFGYSRLPSGTEMPRLVGTPYILETLWSRSAWKWSGSSTDAVIQIKTPFKPMQSNFSIWETLIRFVQMEK